MISLDIVVLLLLLGTVSGFLAGLLGIGGGMIVVPFLTMIFSAHQIGGDLMVHTAIATAMAMIVFTSMSSMRAHHRHGAILWPVVGQFLPGILVGGLLSGGVVFALFNTAWLSLFFALFIGYSALNMLRNKKPKPSRHLPGFWGMSAVGAGIGIVSGLVGAGGGFLFVPFMVWCNVPVRNAVATSAALGFPIAIANSLGYIISGVREVGIQPGLIGYVFWPGLLVLIAMSMLMAPVGARCTHSWPVASIKKIFALLLSVNALYMLRTSLQAFGLI